MTSLGLKIQINRVTCFQHANENRKTVLLSLRVGTVSSHPVQDIYYNRSLQVRTEALVCDTFLAFLHLTCNE